MQTYFFYDLETTGLNKSFDQVLQFAAIRTDLNFKEISRHELKIKLNPDVIPAPIAMVTHKISIQEMLKGISEYDAIKQIHAWLNTPGTISLGYNTLGFDDEFLRFSFYRNLLKPYTHQYANRCFRMDLYPITLMYFLFKKNVIHWPHIDGKPSLKLENINLVNQFIEGRAHDAMIDVEVTLALARKLSKEQEMWKYLQGFFKKELDKSRVQQVENQIAFLVNGKFGFEANFQYPVLFLGNHQHYSNQTVWLRLDQNDFSQITSHTLSENSWGIYKKLGETYFILPPHDRFIQNISEERMKMAEKNKQWLVENAAIFNEIKNYHINYTYPTFENADSDARLYLNGFWNQEEEFFCEQFHRSQINDKRELLNKISNPTLKNLSLRILGRHFPDKLHQHHMDEFADYIRRAHQPLDEEVLIDFQGRKRLTRKAALQEIADIRAQKKLDADDMKLLTDFEIYLQNEIC